MKAILDLIQGHKNGQSVGICSVCSAHKLVIRAALHHAFRNDSLALIEATSNQVNQDGGYTGMRPRDFFRLVHDIADDIGCPRENILLGGDHLGPNCWQTEDANTAMRKSEVLIEQYVEAGFRKIHLDCSMACADDPPALSDDTVATRAARLCTTAEQTWKRVGGEAPVYIVGTEVPVPGGAREHLDKLAVTSPDSAAATVQAHRDAWSTHELEHAWSRVVGLVVQPGVEFGHHNVIGYAPEKVSSLSEFIEGQDNMVFEAHSTDYQTAGSLKELVRDHFAILKVGPALTFALREALWALDRIEREWLGESQASQLRDTVKKAMRDSPRYWQSYYSGSGRQLAMDCEYSLSDRIRYYWPEPVVANAYCRMADNLNNNPPPLTLVSQYLPGQYHAIRYGEIAATVEAIAVHKIGEVLQSYSAACRR